MVHEVPEADPSEWCGYRPEGNASAAGGGIPVQDPGDGSHVGPCTSPFGLQAPVQDLRHGKDPERKHRQVAVFKASGAEEIPLGRTPLEPVLLCGHCQ